MKIIFDLDYTLLDTTKQKKAIAKIFGLSNNEFSASYNKYFKSKKINYNVYKHLSYLLKDKKIILSKSKEIRNEIIALMKRGDNFLFSHAKNLLKQLSEEGHELILLSFGDNIFQSQKIKFLSIKKYFKKIIITDKDKEYVVDFLKKSKESYVIINDNLKESLALKKGLNLVGAKARIILLKGPYSRNVSKNKKTYALKDVSQALDFNLSQTRTKSGGFKIKVLNEKKEVGRLFLYILFNDLHKRPFAIIEDVFVKEDFRQQGLSKMLLTEALRQARKEKCYKIIMWSRYTKPNVHNIYKKFGFKEWGKEFRMNF